MPEFSVVMPRESDIQDTGLAHRGYGRRTQRLISQKGNPMKTKRRRLWSFSKNIGEVPGTLHVDPEAPKPKIQVIAYGPEDFVEKEISELSEIPAFLDKWPVAWVNVDGLGDTKIISAVGEIFGLHPLALEDVVSVPQRAKIDACVISSLRRPY